MIRLIPSCFFAIFLGYHFINMVPVPDFIDSGYLGFCILFALFAIFYGFRGLPFEDTSWPEVNYITWLVTWPASVAVIGMLRLT